MGKLLASERAAKYHDMLFENAAEGSPVVDGSGRIVMKNPRLRELFGYGPSELNGQLIEVLIPVPLRKAYERSPHQYRLSPTHRPMGKGMELAGRLMEGKTFPVEVCLNHFDVDAEGESYVMALVTDITERKLAQDVILQANTELEERVAERAAELRAVLREKVKELVSTINEFHSLEKLEYGSVPIGTEEFDVVHLCIELLEEMRSLTRHRQISYEHSGDERVMVQDRRIFVHVFTNLLNNAIKYSPEDRHIKLTTMIAEGDCTVAVEDEWIGIPAGGTGAIGPTLLSCK